MAGATIEIDDRGVLDALNELLARTGNLEPVLRDIGEHLLNTTRERAAAEVAPDNSLWAPLSAAYAARKAKKKPNAQILVLESELLGARLAIDVGPDSVAIGTGALYGATHQFGDPDRNIPARPFLGLSDTDRAEVLEIVAEYLGG